MQIKRAVIVFTLEDIKILTLFNFFKRFTAVRTSKDSSFRIPIIVVEMAVTDFTPELSFTTVIIVKIDVWSSTTRTGDSIRYFRRIFTSLNRFKFLAMFNLIINEQFFVIKFFKHFNNRHGINLQMLILFVDRYIRPGRNIFAGYKDNKIDNNFLLDLDIN